MPNVFKHLKYSKVNKMGLGCGQVVSMLALYSIDPSSNPAEARISSVKLVFVKNKNKQKEAGFGPFKNDF